jgi:hypothetical protein
LQLAQQYVDSNRSSSVTMHAAETVALVNALAQQHPDIQPAAASVGFGVVSATDLAASGADSITTDGTAINTDCVLASQLVTQLCYMQLPQQGRAAADVEELSAVSVWVDKLSHEAAAAALFSKWYWSQPAAAAAAGDSDAGTAAAKQFPAASSLGVLGLSLYAAARDGKPSLGSLLLLDLALTAAAAAGDWDRGLLCRRLTRLSADLCHCMPGKLDCCALVSSSCCHLVTVCGCSP